MEKEIALCIHFQSNDELLDSFLEMLEANGLQFCGGGSGKIIFAYEDEEEEVPPAIEVLIEWLMGDVENDNIDMIGYIRDRSRESINERQRELIDNWFKKNIEVFKIGELVDVWGKKKPQV